MYSDLLETMRDHWAPLLQAAGLWDDRYHAEDIYFIAGAIIHDEELSKALCAAALAYPGTPDEPGYPTRVDVLPLWTKEQRAALKARIVAKLGARE
jgi:hypothetical protein